jgi:hypothetical protein
MLADLHLDLTQVVTKWERGSPTSAVDGGQGRLFRHLAKKSALHFGGQEERWPDAEALREVEAESG